MTSVFLLVLVYSTRAAPVANSVSEAPVKAPAHSSPPKKGTWAASREAASLWSGDIDGKTLEPTARLLNLECGIVAPSEFTRCGGVVMHDNLCASSGDSFQVQSSFAALQPQLLKIRFNLNAQ